MSEQEDAAYACCSFGIGRWYWAVWENEASAMSGASPLADGYEKSGAAAGKKAAEVAGPRSRRLATKWASRLKRGGPSSTAGGEKPDKPRSRLTRRNVGPDRGQAPVRPSFLYLAFESEDNASRGEVAIVRHRIVRRTAKKIFVDQEPFGDGDESERATEAPDADAPKPRTLAVDRDALRREGKVTHRGGNFYASEDDAVRDVYATMTARHDWCAALGVAFPCSPETIKSAYRRLSRANHPDAGGDPAGFRTVEQAYRDALAYFSSPDDGD